ncbi:MAG: helix-turn-helix domain-containing protein [Chlamydiales bacterium]|nr:helix-turn-helix domain-containing protein [Chlamydiales bacterium]
MEGAINMSIKELERSKVFVQLDNKTITATQAANNLGISSRQLRRLRKDCKKTGVLALISKKRGKASNHQLPTGLKELALRTCPAALS